MPYYAKLENGICVSVIQSKLAILDANLIPITTLNAALIGRAHQGNGSFGGQNVMVDPARWFIDVGPFFDRFGNAKMTILASANANVQALVKDLSIRKWVDLEHPAIAAGIDLLIAVPIAGVDGTLKTAILTTPVTAEESSALRKTYFK